MSGPKKYRVHPACAMQLDGSDRDGESKQLRNLTHGGPELKLVGRDVNGTKEQIVDESEHFQ